MINNNDKISDDCSTTLSAKDMKQLMIYISDQELIVATRAHQLKQAAELATTELASQMLLKEYSGAAVEAAVATQRDADHAAEAAMNAITPCAKRPKETSPSGIVHVPIDDKQEEQLTCPSSIIFSARSSWAAVTLPLSQTQMLFLPGRLYQPMHRNYLMLPILLQMQLQKLR